MAHGITGKAGAVTFAGTGLVGKFRGWEYSPKAQNVDDTGGGDGYKSNLFLRGDFEITCEAVLSGSSPYGPGGVSYGSLIGTEAAVVLLVQVGDVTPAFNGVAQLSVVAMRAPYDDVATQRLTFVPVGTAPTNA